MRSAVPGIAHLAAAEARHPNWLDAARSAPRGTRWQMCVFAKPLHCDSEDEGPRIEKIQILRFKAPRPKGPIVGPICRLFAVCRLKNRRWPDSPLHGRHAAVIGV